MFSHHVRFTVILNSVLFLNISNGLHAQERTPPVIPGRPVWNLTALSVPPQTFPATTPQADGLRAIFYEGLPYRGEPTRVFAWVGLPDVPQGTKVPGIVLVHGGGGTAFEAWVKLWTSRGYAAIAMDNCGGIPIRETPQRWKRHDHSGPPGWGGWNQMDDAPEDQWTYHAVADVILAHSLLRSLPEVDPDRTGITGISWGGYLTCLAAGVDSRFKFAVPVYGCGFTNEHGFAPQIESLGPDKGPRWMAWWDPSVVLPDARMPILWVTGSNDFAYTLNALQKSYRLPTGERTLCIRLRMPHGHGGAGENPKEIQIFADSIVNQGAHLARLTSQSQTNRTASVTFTSPVPIVKAELNLTKATGRWQDRTWDAIPATIEGSTVSAEIPEGTTVYYFNLTDDRDGVISSEHVEVNES